MIQNTKIQQLLESVYDPVLGKSYAELGWAKVVADSLRIRLGYPATLLEQQHLREECEQKAAQIGLSMPIEVRVKIARHAAQAGLKPQPGLQNVIAVGSGKGGVGKSTLAANLALALAHLGAKVGILDADIYGPSQPSIFSVEGKPKVQDKKFIPYEVAGIHMLSIGNLVEDQQAMIWRGPMVSGALLQLFQQTLWPQLDYLIVDLPPGTGDIQLTMAQKLPIAGAVVVTTPQDLSLLDAHKAISMFDKVEIPVLGLIENMSQYVCPHCNQSSALFGDGGGLQVAQQRSLPLLGQIPLARDISLDTERGKPSVMANPDSEASKVFVECAKQLAARLALRPAEYQLSIQTNTVET